MRRLIQILLITIFIMSYAPSSPVLANDGEALLILHSYNQGFSWTDQLHAGIISQLDKTHLTIFTEYLDSYRMIYNHAQTDDRLISTYGSMDLLAIVVTDNAAYEWVLDHSEAFEPGLPVLFCGLNLPSDTQFPDNHTGILQLSDHPAFFDWLEKDGLGITELIIIGADSSTTINTYEELLSYQTTHASQIKLTLIADNDFFRQIDKILSIEEDTIGLYVIGSLDNLDHSEYAASLETSLHLPTFVEVKPAIMGQVLGGFVVDPYEHGKLISHYVSQLEAGSSVRTLPLITKPLISPIFNHNGLVAYNWNNITLPTNALVINSPKNELTLSFKELLLLAIIFGFLIILLLLLMYLIRNKHKNNLLLGEAKTALQEANMDLEAHMEELIASQEELDRQFKELNNSNQKIDYLLRHDDLTDFVRREEALVIIDRYLQNQTPFSIAYCILGGLEDITFTFGYQVYESILKQVTHSLVLSFGTQHYQFAILRRDHLLLICTQPEGLEEALLGTQDNQFNQLYGDNYILYINARFGIATSDMASHAEDILNLASIAALSIEKDRDQFYTYYDTRMRNKILAENILQDEISRALKTREFCLYLQPKYQADNQRLCGYEALIRWPLPGGGFRFPDEFIPLAEKTGQIVPIGDYVIDEACRLIKKYGLHQHGLHIAINLSTQHFIDNQILKILDESMAKYNLPPTCLELELTETSVVKNIEQTRTIFTKLQAKGYSIAIDDMGTGYSSLSHLRDFPINKVKIDRTFVQPLPDPKNMVLIESIISMCQKLGYQVVIEGVETKDHIDLLNTFKPDEYQGYFFSRPQPADQIIKAFLDSQPT